jgi:Fe-S-cluster containining protein
VNKNHLIKSKVTDNTCNHQCSRCGECCGLFIPFTDKELATLKKYVQEHNIQPENRIEGNDFYASCCFFDRKNKICKVYEARPYVCRAFKCDHKDWLKRRDTYELRAKYNSTLSKKFIIATFDDMIYEDYGPLIQYAGEVCSQADGIDSKVLINFFKRINRLDALKYFKVTNDKGETIDAEELLNIEE